MPHASFFSKSAAGYQSDGGEKTRPHRNRLKKRVPFGYSEPNYVAYDLSNLMGNHHSIEDVHVPRPTRPPRPSASDLPDLPGLPIYKTFATDIRPATLLDEAPPPPLPPPPPPPHFQDEQQQPSESATGWVLANSGSGSTPVPIPTLAPPQTPERRHVHPSVRLLDRHEAGFDIVPEVPQRPPQYDRASRLAESYQSLLPDLDSLEYPESHGALQRQHSDQRLRNTGSHRDQWHHKYNPRNSGRFSPPPQAPPLAQQQHSHSLRHTAPRPGTAPAPTPSWQPASVFDTPGGYPPRAGNRGGGGDAHSILTDSSTAVESDGSPMDRFSTTSEMMFPIQGAKALPPTPFHNTNHSQSSSSSDSDTHRDHLHNTRKRTTTTTIPNPNNNLNLNRKDPFTSNSEASLTKEKELKPGGRITSSDYVGLQICSELLTDELLKTFFRRHPTQKRAKASKLQVLLLIEAYEAMLDNCRRELLKVPLPRSAGTTSWDKEKERERAQRRKHIRDAVRILDHWLDSLYVIYDDTFGDLPGEGEDDDDDDDDEEEDECDMENEADTCSRYGTGQRHEDARGTERSACEERVTATGNRRTRGIKGILRSSPDDVQAQPSVPVAPPSGSTSSRLFRGWNRGVGF